MLRLTFPRFRRGLSTFCLLSLCFPLAWQALTTRCPADSLRLAVFQADVTPPVGAPLADGFVEPVADVVDPLTARGLVLLDAGEPIVLCSVDWIGIGNGGYAAWRNAIANAVGTSPDRVVVHCVHQHDAPGCDFDAENLLSQAGLSGAQFHVSFAHEAIQRVAAAANESISAAQEVTHLTVGKGQVHQVASNRRVLGEDGNVKAVRWSATKDEAVRNEPEGTVDPFVRLIGWQSGERTLACSTYYATHPQSYYGQGHVTWDFVGMARAERERALPGIPLIHFNGAGGNVTAGKYNDGSPEIRPQLADRLAEGMKAAWDGRTRHDFDFNDVEWRTRTVVLPVSPGIADEAALLTTVNNTEANTRQRIEAARNLAFARRVAIREGIQLSCLRLGDIYILHMPGELFVEYQLAAQEMRPDDFVCMAAYGDYGPGYIGTAISYGQGGYETGPASLVTSTAEPILLEAMRDLLR